MKQAIWWSAIVVVLGIGLGQIAVSCSVTSKPSQLQPPPGTEAIIEWAKGNCKETWHAVDIGLSDCSVSFTDIKTGHLHHLTANYDIEWIGDNLDDTE